MPSGIYKHKPHSKETLKKMKVRAKGRNLGRTQDKAGSWKGDGVGYHGLHLWVVKWKGNPDTCEMCGDKGNSHKMHWANIDHKYRRILDDYIRLCPKCHYQYDHNLRLR